MTTNNSRKAVAVDLDGTLLHTNTFKDYLSYCGNVALHSFDFGIAVSIAWWVTLRKLRLISHSRMKHALLRRTSNFMMHRGRLDQFVEQELTLVNDRVLHLIEPYRSRGYLLILTTAAPGLYAHPIADSLQLHLCCATPLPSEVVIGQWKENVGPNKLDALRRLLAVHKTELAAVVTDHFDDLPLLNSNEGENFVVSPSSVTQQLLQKECKRPYTVIQ